MLERDLFGLLEHTTDAAFAVTDGGEICSWNAGAEALFGFGRGEVLGKTCFELFQGRDALGTLTCTEQCHVRDCAARHTPTNGRRRIVHLARSVEDRKRAEVIVQRMLLVSRQLVEVSDQSFRPAPVSPLSEQEHRVLRSFSEGKSSADIVRELDITPQTLRNHLHHINQKLGTHNRLEAVLHAMRRSSFESG
jgi:PAS domain S-box-containing protein